MPILRLLRGSSYGPPEIEIMTRVYEEVLRLSGIKDRASIDAERLAMRIIAHFSDGETDPAKIARVVSLQSTSLNTIKIMHTYKIAHL